MTEELEAVSAGEAAALLVVLERERAELLDAIHDDALQLLALAGMKTDLAFDLMAADKVRQGLLALSDARRALGSAVGELRGVMARGRAFKPTHESLADAVYDLTSQLGADHDVTVDVDGEPPEFSDSLGALAFYRFFQSALVWVVRGLGATEVDVRLDETGLALTWGRLGDVAAMAEPSCAELRAWAGLLGANLRLEGRPPCALELRLSV